jgi:tetratricopeptide (TPR) repeat protein
MAHLFELCSHCRSEFEAWRGELGAGVARDEGDYDGAVQRIRERTAANDLGPDAEEARLGRERRDARSRAEELLALPDDQRLDWIQSEKDRHSGLLLAEALIEECRRETPADPHRGFSLADLARIVLTHERVTGHAVEMYALALAHLANSIRVVGDLPRAEQVLTDARYMLRSQGGGDRSIRAEIDGLLCSLLIGQERSDEAIRVALRAMMASRLEGDEAGHVKMVIKLSRAHAKKRQHQLAIECLVEVDQCHDVTDRRIRLIIRQNLAAFQARQGHAEQAAAHLLEAESLLEGSGDRVSRLRFHLISGDIRRLQGDQDGTEHDLLTAHAGFCSIGLQYDQAICAHSLADFYAELGESARALERFEEALAVFERLHLSQRILRLVTLRKQLVVA